MKCPHCKFDFEAHRTMIKDEEKLFRTANPLPLKLKLLNFSWYVLIVLFIVYTLCMLRLAGWMVYQSYWPENESLAIAFFVDIFILIPVTLYTFYQKWYIKMHSLRVKNFREWLTKKDVLLPEHLPEAIW